MLITYLKFTKKECKGAEERKKIKSVCNFKGLKNNKSNYECKECKKIWLKPVNRLIKKVPNINQFCNGDINKIVLLLRKAFIHMNTWIAEKDLMKHHYQIKKLFTANCIYKTLPMKITLMLKIYLKN